MALYHIQLPGTMTLTIEITDNPVHFSISFPDGRAVHFDHSASGDRIDIDPGLNDEHDTVKKTHAVSSPPGGSSISFSDPGGSM